MMITRTCWKCKEEKGLYFFPNDKNKKLGKDYICSDCKVIVKKEYHQSETYRLYVERTKDSRNALHKKYRQSEKGKLVSINKSKRMREKYPEKDTARRKLRYAVKTGKIKKDNCIVCGDTKVHGHHTDYLKPLDVIWLCDFHHKETHKII